MSEYKVLIVEDNKINMKIMRDLLGVHGYQTLEAGDGPVGMDMAQKHRPDLILMDIQLPTMNGYDVTRKLKEQDDTKDIPIVVVTSLAMKGEKDQAREAGCDAYISKPIDIHKFIETVKGFLPEKDPSE